VIRVGDAVTPWELPSVSREKMKTMAVLLDDSNPIHFDVDVVRALGMGDRPINQGPSNLAYVMNMLGAWAGGVERVRRVSVRFVDNVRGEDHVIARGTVTNLSEVDGRKVAECDVELVVAGGGVVLTGTASVDMGQD
jgi:acyl dehydratase